MALTLSAKAADLLSWDKKAFAHLALVLKSGVPQVTPVWFDWDGTHIVVNTARGRVKDKAMAPGVRVALSIVDPADPYRYIQVQGQVVAETEEGAREMIDHLAQKYIGQAYPWHRGETRVTYKILPEKISPAE